jgi:pilus assembly protein CpaB
MWKVKRMNTARIVVLAIAVGAGGIAAYPASGSDCKPLALHSIADVNTPEIRTDERTSRRGESVNVVRYGVNSPTTTQK